jgi:hypothetical protein
MPTRRRLPWHHLISSATHDWGFRPAGHHGTDPAPHVSTSSVDTGDGHASARVGWGGDASSLSTLGLSESKRANGTARCGGLDRVFGRSRADIPRADRAGCDDARCDCQWARDGRDSGAIRCRHSGPCLDAADRPRLARGRARLDAAARRSGARRGLQLDIRTRTEGYYERLGASRSLGFRLTCADLGLKAPSRDKHTAKETRTE